MLVIDGTNLILGRAATHIAKKLLEGEEVHLINSEKVVITGNPKVIIKRYTDKRRIKHKGTPERSPTWSKVPNLLVRRMIRGMLPWKKARGRGAYKRLRVYLGNPKNLKGDKIDGSEFTSTFHSIKILQLCKNLGYSP